LHDDSPWCDLVAGLRWEVYNFFSAAKLSRLHLNG
jgi:hypothetical protein